MRNMTRIFALCATMSAGLTLSACGDDSPTNTTTATTGGTQATTGTANPNPTGPNTNTGTGTGDSTGGANVVPGCNPVGADPAMSALLNKPLGPTVQVIVKTPAHPNPGVPGPDGLPQ